MLADRPDGTVVGLGAVVAKAHPPSASGAEAEEAVRELTVRLRTAAHPRLAGILLPPLGPPGHPVPRRLEDGRLATVWPRGTAVDPDAPEAAPWEAAGMLLARLHSVPPRALTGALPGPLPVMRGPAKAARAMRRMRAATGGGPLRTAGAAPAADAPADALAGAVEAVEYAWATLPAWCRAEEPPPPTRGGTLCHGDFHLGQLVAHPGPDGPWHLIDIDDLGLGDPAWDLARPAAWYAAGLLHADSWNAFLRAYQKGTGTSAYDPWPRLDAPARALTVQTAALAVAKAHEAGRPLDEAEAACAEACARIGRIARAEEASAAPAPISGNTSTTSAVTGSVKDTGT